MITITKSPGCLVCGARLQTVLDLGNLHVSAFPLPPEPDSITAPLDLTRCTGCGLVQLRDRVDPSLLYQEYWYRSAVNEVMVKELDDVVREAVALVPVGPGDRVVDIGANDGTLLHAYNTHAPSVVKVAYEPAGNLQAPLEQIADVVVPTTFPPQKAYLPTKVKIVTSIACFYDVADPVGFAKVVAGMLAPDGVWVVQFQDLAQMIQATAYDNICHEHLLYLTLRSLNQIAAAANLHIRHAVRRTINGGSLRVFLGHQIPVSVLPVKALKDAEAGCESWVALERFGDRVRERREQLRSFFDAAQVQGKTIDLYAASTKANTLLQYAKLDSGMIRQAWERSPEKVGRLTVGTHIPIVSEEIGRANPPDLLLLGAWQFRDAFVRREMAYLEAGGTMLVPLPEVEFIRGAR